MIVRKTVKIKLDSSNKSKIDRLEKCWSLVQSAASQYLKHRKSQLETKDFSKTGDKIYAELRSSIPDLNSAVLQQTTRRCDELIRSHIAWCKKKHKILELNQSPRMPISIRDTKVEISKTSKEFEAWLYLWRVKFPLKLAAYQADLLKRATGYTISKITKTEDSNFVLHLGLEFDVKERVGTKTLGVDIGIVKPIVCSDGKQFGNGRLIKHKKIEFGKKRAKQASKAKDISAKQSRWTSDTNHKLSKQLINHCLLNEIDVLSLEKLSGASLSNRKHRKYNWAFKDLLAKIEYKAKFCGIKVVCVDPRCTSRTCSSCGSQSKDNRETQSLFACKSCGARMNADVNAAKNIRSLSALEWGKLTIPEGKTKTLESPSFS